MSRRIVFTFKADDSVIADSSGFKGPVCVKTTEKLLAGLGAQAKNTRLKNEYNLVTNETQINIPT